MSARLSLAVLATLVTTVAAAEEKFRFERPLMGTRFTIVCHAPDRAAAGQAAEAAFAIATEVNSIASDYLPDSELSQLAAQPTDTPAPLSPRLYEMLNLSRQLAETTGGAFDPALGELTRLWRETRDHRRLPDPEKLQAARAASGWRHFTLDPASRSITLRRAHLAFDLGGVAKGYAADLMLESLAAAGISRAAGAGVQHGPGGRCRRACREVSGSTPLEVPLKELHALLRTHGAIIPGDV